MTTDELKKQGANLLHDWLDKNMTRTELAIKMGRTISAVFKVQREGIETKSMAIAIEHATSGRLKKEEVAPHLFEEKNI